MLGRWKGAYDTTKRMKQSGSSKNDVLARTHTIYVENGNGTFNLMQEWDKVRDQPRYMSQVGGNTRSDRKDASKKKGKGKSSRTGKAEALEIVEEDWDEYKQFKKKEFKRLDKIVLAQQEVAKAHQEATRVQEEASRIKLEAIRAKKMKLFMKLSFKEHLDDYNKQVLEMLKVELFDN
ncbi:hypothetical protein LIER_13901 [Lithospermum erythrorhizon]|uniref:No apical meristem-associated C-terminal domain-containing protein n=1 Tax=Lithospermum erythrorhizon TaxID=34254 RepID=A0AAV3PX71_LITER